MTNTSVSQQKRVAIEETGRHIIGECDGISYVVSDFAPSDWAKLSRTPVQQVAARFIVHAEVVQTQSA